MFMALIAILAINQFVIRTKQWETRQWLFWLVQLSSVLFGSLVILWGLPGFTGELNVNWLVGLLFFFHAARNYLHFQHFQREQKQRKKEQT
jgi:hypothetical protein